MEEPQSITVDDVIINGELLSRSSRPPDYEEESKALLALGTTMNDSPHAVFQSVVETALRLCRAHTAGISLLEKHDGQDVFRWEALAGVFADRLNHLMPRNASPCGTVIDRNATQLMYMAERFYPSMRVDPPIVEALLIPFHYNGAAVGTVWVVFHDQRRKFDREDERIVKSLAAFASAAWQLWKAREMAETATASEQRRREEMAVKNKLLQFQREERERVEAKLQQLNKQLEQRVLERTHELETAYKQLRETQVLGAIGIAAAKIIHDLANPLNNISTAVKLLHELTETEVGESNELTSVLAGLQAETVHVHTLIDELRQFARPTDPSLRHLELPSLLQEVVSCLASDAMRSKVTVEQEIEEALPAIAADGEKLRRALLNLCMNAIEAMPNGGKLSLRSFRQADTLVIEVQDSGTGIQPGMQIFDAFTTSKQNGWGLGLAIVQQIIAAHRGMIKYVSEPGDGTIFTISLPAT